MADTKQNTQPTKANSPQQFVLGKENYIMLIAAVAILIVGYFLMAGGGNGGDPTKFAGETLFNTQRLVIAPLVIMGGFLLGLFAILKKPKA